MILDGKEISAVASDLDGTLLGDSPSDVDGRVFGLIRELNARGVRFVAASGRQYENMAQIFAPVKDDIYFVCENGSIVVYRDELIHEDLIADETARELLDDIPRYLGGINTIVSSGGRVYGLSSQGKFVDEQNRVRKQCFRKTDDFSRIRGKINKIAILFPDGRIDGGKDIIAKYSPRLECVDAGDGWLDFTSKTASKGRALLLLREKLLGRETEYVSFGDSGNDISMFNVSALSYAMAHSRSEVKAAAGHECANVVQTLEALLRGELK